MKRYLLYNVYAALFLGLLCGCAGRAGRREMQEVFLAQVLGVDWAWNEVALTASDGERLLRAEGGSAEKSHQRLKESGEGYVALTHVEHIVVGERSDLRAVLEGALKGEEVGQGAWIWAAEEGTARELLEQAGGGAKRLEAIGSNTAGFRPLSVMEALVWLEETGRVAVPALEMEDGMLTLAGERVWRED